MLARHCPRSPTDYSFLKGKCRIALGAIQAPVWFSGVSKWVSCQAVSVLRENTASYASLMVNFLPWFALRQRSLNFKWA